ncbi:MAG: sulfur oxidation c-type cytochrome SoxX [Pseudorhodoplanes sp.]|jgi:sulfur-oxidizing protein SoxX|nr:sulfur oxidation c-type cytochrome SoxX [Pseudorhodoplanes sp.]
MKKLALLIGAVALTGIAAAQAQQKTRVDPAKVDAAIKAAFPAAPEDWAPRLTQDETMKQCSAARNNPDKKTADAIVAREKASIEYPADGNYVGDWKKGEALAQSGYGLRFTDYPPRRANGGNCYACHQLTKKEVSYGTLGPSLLEYGKLREFKPEAIKATYEKIYNSHVAQPCSNMPRFGANKVLTIDQIKDAVALLMSPDSPVNKGE